MPFNIKWVNNQIADIQKSFVSTPFGNLVVHSFKDVIYELDWIDHSIHELDLAQSDDSIKTKLESFWRSPEEIITLKLMKRGSIFQNKVWSELLNIPFGLTRTYKEIAVLLNSAPRPVGGACRKNFYPLVIPCHRIVAVSGIGGYSGKIRGDMISIKQKLLQFEQDYINGKPPSY